ncbi:MAG: DUF3592 domain-containing protein [Candidatus Hodarchaeales archaeon]|jgi:hypothetical protein
MVSQDFSGNYKRDRSGRRLGFYLFIVIPLIINLPLYVFYELLKYLIKTYRKTLILFHEARSSQSWSITQGEIVHSNIIKQVFTGETGPSISYDINVQYKYAVSGETYVGSRIMIQPISDRISSTSLRESSYKVGSTVQVYYNPESPQNSVLELGVTFDFYLSLIILPMLFIILILVLGGLQFLIYDFLINLIL